MRIAHPRLMLALLAPTLALDNGVGLTPSMGWSSWNTFRCAISERLIREVAQAIVTSGLRDAGYRYVNVDDCWMESRGADGHIIPSAKRFPNGMKAIGDYIHSLGLKFGIYSDAGERTCETLPGSFGHEEQDAADYASWGVDYLKYDYCNMTHAPRRARYYYARMRNALNATGRPIVFSICSWGVDSPHTWGARVGHSWRTGKDLFAVWDAAAARRLRLPPLFATVMEAVETHATLADFAAPGGYNDPDMLLVGLPGMSPYGVINDTAAECPPHVPTVWCERGAAVTREQWGLVGGLTRTEQRAHFSLWCMLAAPLMIGNDPRHMSRATVEILTATELIAINQDPLGRQARLVRRDGALQVWRKELADGTHAVLLFNAGDVPADITVEWSRDLADASREFRRQLGREPPCKDIHEARYCAYEVKVAGGGGGGRCARDREFALKCSRTCGVCAPERWARGQHAMAAVRDAWAREYVGVFPARFTARLVEAHEARVFTLRFDGYTALRRLVADERRERGIKRKGGAADVAVAHSGDNPLDLAVHPEYLHGNYHMVPGEYDGTPGSHAR